MQLNSSFIKESWADGFLSYIAHTCHLRIRLGISVEQAFSLIFLLSLFFPLPCKNSSTSCFQLGRKYQRKSLPWTNVFWYICFLFCLKQSRTVNTKTRKWKQRALNKIFFVSSMLRHLNLILCRILACVVLRYSEFMGIIDYICGRNCFHNMQM